MDPHHGAGAAALLLSAALLTSCSAPEPEPTAQPEAADPVELCAAFADVETIIINAGTGFRDARMQEQEYQGWLRIAARALSRIDADVATSLGAAIAAAQLAAPAVPIGTVGEAFDPLSTNWGAASIAVRDACLAEGIELVGEGFTGG
jgi:hypothetical protein